MISDYYSKEQLINVLSSYNTAKDLDRVDWDSVINDGEIYDGVVNGVQNPYIYEVPGEMNIVYFIHPQICTEVYWDAWIDKETFMRHEDGLL